MKKRKLKKIKIGFLVNNDNIDNYNYQLLKWLLKNDDKFEVSSFISIKDPKKKIIFKKIPCINEYNYCPYNLPYNADD